MRYTRQDTSDTFKSAAVSELAANTHKIEKVSTSCWTSFCIFRQLERQQQTLISSLRSLVSVNACFLRSAMTDGRGYYCYRYRRFSRATASLIRLLQEAQEETAAWWWRELSTNHALQAAHSIHTNCIPYRSVFIPAVSRECKLPNMHLYNIPIHVRSRFRPTDSNGRR